LQALSHLKKEEKSLRNVLDVASESLQERRRKELKRREEEAASRLELALMGDSSDDDVENSSGINDGLLKEMMEENSGE